MDLGLEGKAAVVTGGGGAICGAIAEGLAGEGARVAIWDLSEEAAGARCATLQRLGARALAVRCDVTDPSSVAEALQKTVADLGGVEILVNGAGGSSPLTTTGPEREFFAIGVADMRKTVDLNYLSAVSVSQSIGQLFARQRRGVILNIASVVGVLPITRALTYSDSKAALISFTRWLAVHMAQQYSPLIRVNALAPGFVLTEQNRFLLHDEQGRPTQRAERILQEVPMRRIGESADMVGAALWLLSQQACFVTGVVLPVDGGFTAFAGV